MTPTRFTPTRVLALLLLGAATVSFGVLAAPTTSSMDSDLFLTGLAPPGGSKPPLVSHDGGSLIGLIDRRIQENKLKATEKYFVRFTRLLDAALQQEKFDIHQLIPEHYGKIKTDEDRQNLFRHDPDVEKAIRTILKDSVEVVRFREMTRDDFVARAEANHRDALAFLPDGLGKVAAKQEMTDAQKSSILTGLTQPKPGNSHSSQIDKDVFRTNEYLGVRFTRLLDVALQQEKGDIYQIIPEHYGTITTDEDRQNLFRHDPDVEKAIRIILKHSVEVVGLKKVTRSDRVQRAKDNFEDALTFLPSEEEKREAEKELANAQTARQLFSTSKLHIVTSLQCIMINCSKRILSMERLLLHTFYNCHLQFFIEDGIWQGNVHSECEKISAALRDSSRRSTYNNKEDDLEDQDFQTPTRTRTQPKPEYKLPPLPHQIPQTISLLGKKRVVFIPADDDDGKEEEGKTGRRKKRKRGWREAKSVERARGMILTRALTTNVEDEEKETCDVEEDPEYKNTTPLTPPSPPPPLLPLTSSSPDRKEGDKRNTLLTADRVEQVFMRMREDDFREGEEESGDEEEEEYAEGD
ncbi:hypothetical protein EV360DRAFT_75610 [Lentinula raphanica]|nr:hypothetical protein EV360DRAFT_75610 [Lentinula raphanica]